MNRKYLITTIIIVVSIYFIFAFYSHLERTKNLESEIVHLQKESIHLKQESTQLKEELKRETNARQKTNEDSKNIMGSKDEDLEKKIASISNNKEELNSILEEIKTKMKELDRKVNDLEFSSVKRNVTRTGDSECYSNETAVIVTSRWMQEGKWVYDTDWMKDAGLPIVTYYRSKKETEYRDKNYRFPYDSEGLLINKARDALCYLTYVVDCYHSLPQNVAFIHGHNYSWHAETNVAKLLKHLKWGEKGFYNLNYDTEGEISLFQGYNDNREECEAYYKENNIKRKNDCTALNGGWSRIGPHWGTLVESHGLGSIPKFVTFASCAQFVVRKDFILKNTLEYYQWLQHWVLDVGIPQHEVSIILEHFFHFIFTHQGMMDFTRVKDIVKDSFYTDNTLETFQKVRKD